jgi:hypothetical protein
MKKSWITVIVLILVILLFCCCLTGITYWMVTHSPSGAKPKDLGVRYTMADLNRISEKTGIAIDTAYGKSNEGTAMFYEGEKAVDVVLTQAEVSAYLNYLNSPRVPVKDVQVKLTENKAEVSAMATYKGTAYPVDAIITGTAKGNTASGTIMTIYVGGINIPANYRKMIAKALFDLINSRLKRIKGLNIIKFEIKNGKLILVGTFPAKAWRAKEAAPLVK